MCDPFEQQIEKGKRFSLDGSENRRGCMFSGHGNLPSGMMTGDS